MVPDSNGSPGLNCSATAAAICSVSDRRDRGTSILVRALHVCPEFRKHFATPSLIACWRSASSRMMFGDLPPSSSATRLIVPAAASLTRRPAAVDPVKEIASTSGCSASASPMTEPRPVTRLKTPAGRPTSSITSASSIAFRGATWEGFRTTVQPAASAGATFAAIWCSG